MSRMPGMGRRSSCSSRLLGVPPRPARRPLGSSRRYRLSDDLGLRLEFDPGGPAIVSRDEMYRRREGVAALDKRGARWFRRAYHHPTVERIDEVDRAAIERPALSNRDGVPGGHGVGGGLERWRFGRIEDDR